MRDYPKLPAAFLLASLAAFMVLFLAVPFALAEDGVKDNQAAQAVDYSGALDEIERLLGELPDRASIGDLSDKLDALTPVDSSGCFEDVSTLLGGSASVLLFILVVELMQLGAVLALIFVVSLRTNR